jgi:hypothetical protein
MPTLIERLRAAREQWTTVEGHSFLIRRPTAYEAAHLMGRGNDDTAVVRTCVVAWRDVRELDIVPGGDDAPAAFSPDVLVEWAQDRPAIWNHIIGEVTRRVAEYFAAGETVEKK